MPHETLIFGPFAVDTAAEVPAEVRARAERAARAAIVAALEATPPPPPPDLRALIPDHAVRRKAARVWRALSGRPENVTTREAAALARLSHSSCYDVLRALRALEIVTWTPRRARSVRCLVPYPGTVAND